MSSNWYIAAMRAKSDEHMWVLNVKNMVNNKSYTFHVSMSHVGQSNTEMARLHALWLIKST